MNKKTYAILSGEGDHGSWRTVTATDIGIKRILTRERCHGDRWARAYYHPDDDSLSSDVGVDVETGELCEFVFPR